MTSTLQIPSCASSDRTSSCRRQHRPSAGSICQSGNVVQSDALGCLLNWVFTFSYDVTSSIRIAKPSRWMDALALLRDEEALSRHKAHVLRICSPSRIAPSACQRVLFFVSFRRTKQATRPFGSTRQDQILVRLEPQTSVVSHLREMGQDSCVLEMQQARGNATTDFFSSLTHLCQIS